MLRNGRRYRSSWKRCFSSGFFISSGFLGPLSVLSLVLEQGFEDADGAGGFDEKDAGFTEPPPDSAASEETVRASRTTLSPPPAKHAEPSVSVVYAPVLAVL